MATFFRQNSLLSPNSLLNKFNEIDRSDNTVYPCHLSIAGGKSRVAPVLNTSLSPALL